MRSKIINLLKPTKISEIFTKIKNYDLPNLEHLPNNTTWLRGIAYEKPSLHKISKSNFHRIFIKEIIPHVKNVNKDIILHECAKMVLSVGNHTRRVQILRDLVKIDHLNIPKFLHYLNKSYKISEKNIPYEQELLLSIISASKSSRISESKSNLLKENFFEILKLTENNSNYRSRYARYAKINRIFASLNENKCIDLSKFSEHELNGFNDYLLRTLPCLLSNDNYHSFVVNNPNIFCTNKSNYSFTEGLLYSFDIDIHELYESFFNNNISSSDIEAFKAFVLRFTSLDIIPHYYSNMLVILFGDNCFQKDFTHHQTWEKFNLARIAYIKSNLTMFRELLHSVDIETLGYEESSYLLLFNQIS